VTENIVEEEEKEEKKLTTSVDHSFSSEIDMKIRLVFLLAVAAGRHS